MTNGREGRVGCWVVMLLRRFVDRVRGARGARGERGERGERDEGVLQAEGKTT